MTEIKKFKFTVEIDINATTQIGAKNRLRNALNDSFMANFQVKEIKELA